HFAFPSFDASVSEIFVSLCSGGTLYIVGERIKQDPVALSDYIHSNGIAIATLPPVLLHQMDIRSLCCLKQLITAGEAAIASDVREFLSYGNYINAYGPTETSICATVYRHEQGSELLSERVPIGHPIANTCGYVLHAYVHVVRRGVSGELYISGGGVGDGCFGVPEQTGCHFGSGPFRAGSRMDRSGDLGYRGFEGHLCFAGRRDG